MSVFENTLPTVPDSTSDYFIIYYSELNEYRYFNPVPSDKNVTVVDGRDTIRVMNNIYCYNPDTDTDWYLNDSLTASSPYVSSDDGSITLVYSSYDIYTSDNKLYYSSGNDISENVVAGTVSSSSILSTLKSGVLPLVSIVIAAVVGIIALRRAWNWLRSAVKGA